MQNGKENFKEFMKTIKEKVRDWGVSYNRKLWTTRIFVYAFLLLLVIFVGAILFTHFNLFHTNANSARYMLSALVQSQAAIVAIVITLTLIAVQLTASAYSPRVIDIFKKNPDMWLLMGCYGFSIFYGFIVLKLVEGAEGEVVSQSAIWSLGSVSISFEFFVSLAYWLGAFTFVALFPYMKNIISLLKPENIIERLAIEITKDKILNSKEDPIQPIMDIIHDSTMNYDIETTRVSIKAVTDHVIDIIDCGAQIVISRHVCNHLERTSKLALRIQDEEVNIEVVKNLEKFGKTSAGKGFAGASMQAVLALTDVGTAAAEKGLEVATVEAVSALEAVRTATTGKGFAGASMQAVSSLKDVGTVAVEKGLEVATVEAIWALKDVGTAAVATGKGFTVIPVKAVLALKEVGTAAAEEGLEVATVKAVWALKDIGTAAAEKGYRSTIVQAVWALKDVGTVTAEKGLGGALVEAVWAIGDVGAADDAEQSFRLATMEAVLALAKLTHLREENVKKTVQKIFEKDSSFHKFINLYEQELEKLRAEK